jgi:MFS family permease
VLRNRSLLGLLTAELVSLTGSSMTFVALPWFVLVTTGSTAKMGWVLAAEMLPIAVFGIPAGSLIARIGAKRTMLLSDAARGPLLLVLPILHHTGHLTFPASSARRSRSASSLRRTSRPRGSSFPRSRARTSARSPR